MAGTSSWQKSPATGSETQAAAQSDPPTDAISEHGETPQGTSDAGDGQHQSVPDDLEQLKAALERANTALKKANKESAEHRHKAKELDELKGRLEAEKLTEKERLEQQVSQLQQQLAQRDIERQDRLVNAEVKASAAQAGWQHPELAIKLLDRAELEFDEDGTPSNVETVLKNLAKQYPNLIGKSNGMAAGGTTNPSRSQTTGPFDFANKSRDEVERFLGGLTQEAYNKLTPETKREISRWRMANPPGVGRGRNF